MAHRKFKGVWMMQSHYLETVQSMVSDASQVLEVGAFLGGFTMVIDEALTNETAEILTYENNHDMPYRFTKPVTARTHFPWRQFTHKVTLREEDIFEDYEVARELIIREGKTVVFCDGGDKIREFDLLSQYLKKGDVICTHDYGLNHEDFSATIGDAWDKDPQVVYEDIRPFVEREGLSLNEDIDPRSIWGVFTKL